MKNRKVVCALLIILLFSCSQLGFLGNDGKVMPFSIPSVRVNDDISCTYFVSPSGSDAGSGSESQPWGTFQHAVDSAQSGDTVCFRGGNYVMDEPIYITQSGTSESPITFIAYPDEQPILDGGGDVGGILIFEQGTSYLKISGFALRNFNIWGVDLSGENYYVHLDHLTIEGGEAGVHFTFGDDDLASPEGGPVEHITLEDSTIYNSQYTAVDCTPGPCNNMVFRRLEVYGSGISGESSFGADGIAISRGYPVLVEDCYVHDNGGDGIDLNSRDYDGHAEGIVVRRNRVVGNHQNGIKLWAGGLIENNILWGQGNSALWIGTFHSDLEVINNTIAFNMWDGSYSERNWVFSAGYPEDIVSLPEVNLLLVNNIFAFNTGPEVGAPTGVYLGPGVEITEHNNLYFSREDGEITSEFLDRDITRQELADGTWADLTGQGQNNLTSDPLFASGWPDVQIDLQSSSPAIDAGDSAFCPAEDVFGNSRLIAGDGNGKSICDLGAVEWSE